MSTNLQEQGFKERGTCSDCEEKLYSLWSNMNGWMPDRHHCKGPSAATIRRIIREELAAVGLTRQPEGNDRA